MSLTLLAQDSLTLTTTVISKPVLKEEVYVTYTKDISLLSHTELFYELTNSISSELNFKLNSAVQKEIDLYNHNNGAYIRKSLKNGEKYLPLIENILMDKDMPLALKYLPAIESKMNPYAKSYMGAAGIWQIMPRTAIELKLRVSGRIDERRNVPKSTDKATNYLKRLQKINNDWILTIAAYNCGQGNVNKAIRKSRSRNFWELRKFLPKETQKYVPRFFAIVYLMEKHKVDNSPNGYIKSYEVKEVKTISTRDYKSSDFKISNKKNSCKINPAIKTTQVGDHKPHNKVLFDNGEKESLSYFDIKKGIIIKNIKRLSLGDGSIKDTNKITKSKSQLKTFNQLKNNIIKPTKAFIGFTNKSN